MIVPHMGKFAHTGCTARTGRRRLTSCPAYRFGIKFTSARDWSVLPGLSVSGMRTWIDKVSMGINRWSVTGWIAYATAAIAMVVGFSMLISMLGVRILLL